MKKKILMTMLFIVSAFMVFFGVNGINGAEPEQAMAAETSSTTQFFVVEANNKNIHYWTDSSRDNYLDIKVQFYMSDDIYNRIGETTGWVIDEITDGDIPFTKARHRFVKKLVFMKVVPSLGAKIYYQHKEFSYLDNKDVIFYEMEKSELKKGVNSFDLKNLAVLYSEDAWERSTIFNTRDEEVWLFPLLVSVREDQKTKSPLLRPVENQPIEISPLIPLITSSNYISCSRREIAEEALKTVTPGQYSV